MKKVGLSHARTAGEWFDPLNQQHLIAWELRRKNQQWPVGFLPDDVWESGKCPETIQEKLQGMPIPADVTAYIAEYERVGHIVSQVRFPGYLFRFSPLGEFFAVQVEYDEPDVHTGLPARQVGRLWVFPRGQTTDQIVQTCFKAVLTSMEHRVRETFTWRGKAVMVPHRDLEAVWRML
jgi:hypothetical protein